MIKRTLYQFGLCTCDDESRSEVWHLAETLRGLLPEASIDTESAKTDLTVLRIEIDEVRA